MVRVPGKSLQAQVGHCRVGDRKGHEQTWNDPEESPSKKSERVGIALQAGGHEESADGEEAQQAEVAKGMVSDKAWLPSAGQRKLMAADDEERSEKAHGVEVVLVFHRPVR